MTLTEFKNNIRKYEFKLISNSWSKRVPEFQAKYRRVGVVTSRRFTLKTDKKNDGYMVDSWLYFPKKGEATFIYENDGTITLKITRDCGEDMPPHVMIYNLKKI